MRHFQKTPAEIEKMQQRKLKKLVKFAVKHSKFYQKFYQGIDVNDFKLEQLPILTKQEMMANWDDLVTDNRLKRADVEAFFLKPNTFGTALHKKFICSHTSGTTGVKGVVAYTNRNLDLVGALGISRGLKSPFKHGVFKLLRSLPLRMAAIVNTSGHHTAHLTLHHGYAQNPLVRFRAFSLFTPHEELIRELNAYQPKLIATYATCIETLAHEQLRGSLKISIDHPMSVLGSFGERLTSRARDLAKKAFNFGVQNVYGCSECLELGRDCPEHSLHIHSDYLILENVDEMNRPVPPGQMGAKVLMTSLFNHIMPLIRYELGDMITIAKGRCSCGSPFPYIEEISGRKNDSFYLRNTNGQFEEVRSWNFVSTIVNLDNIKQGQIVQEDYDKILMRFVPFEGVKLDVPRIIQQQKDDFQAMHLDPNIKVEVEVLDFIPRDPVSQKYRPVIRQVPVPKEFLNKQLEISLMDEKKDQPASKPSTEQIIYATK